MCKKIKPLVYKKGKLSYIRPCEPRNTAFSWDPKRAAKGLRRLANITTYHTYGYYGFFKPSVAEVLAQIPSEYVNKACAFVTHGPETAADLNRHSEELNEGYHVAITTLFEKT